MLPPMATRQQKAASAGDLQAAFSDGLKKSASGQLLAAAAARLHAESRWEATGGWRADSKERRQAHRMERDDSMVNLLNLLDPASLVDSPLERAGAPGAGPEGGSPRVCTRKRSMSGLEQHSALSRRGAAIVGALSAFAWYILRLVIRDRFVSRQISGRHLPVLELHALSSMHALGWVFFLLQKLRGPVEEFPKYCSRALVASLGFYLHDCWALRGTLLYEPGHFAHQASMALTIASILRSKGVAWLAPPLMSLAVPTLVQELLQLCGTVGLPATRPEVLSLRFLWFASFAASRLALLPLWLKRHSDPELHQPNLFWGKVSYLVGLALNLRFIASAARDLPRFLRPSGARLSAAAAYRLPLRGARVAGTAAVASAVLAGIFGSYLFAPAAATLALLAAAGHGSFAGPRLRGVAGVACAIVALDQVLPMPTECSPTVTRLLLPFLRAVKAAFRHRFYPKEILSAEDYPRDRHYLLAVTPHGFFPWGAGGIIFELLHQGYLPNFLGASVLGSLPVAGRLLRCAGYRPATRKEMLRCLQKPYPRNMTIVIPGGIHEMFAIRQDVELSVANTRRGFAELAVEGGAVLVPGYMFGSSRLYRVAEGWIGEFFEGLSRRLKTSLNLFHGRWGTLLPYPHPLACALGEAIDTRKVRDPKQVHRLWQESLRRAFEDHKAEFGWPNMQLYFAGEALPKPPEDPWLSYAALPTSRL